VDDAKAKFVDCIPVRDEVSRLKAAISRNLSLKELLCECGWSVTHFRGCLESFQILASQHPEVMSVLKGKAFLRLFPTILNIQCQDPNPLICYRLIGRTLIFGHETGVTMDGHVVLNR